MILLSVSSYWLVNSLLAILIGGVLAGFLIPQILLVAFRKQLFDEVDERKIHRGVVPRLGGIAFQPVIFFTMFFLLGINELFGYTGLSRMLSADMAEFAGGYCAVISLYLVGIADDLIGVRYRAKFIVQIICALILVCVGVYIDNLYGLFLLSHLPVYVSIPLTVLLVVFIINAVNLIDGIDGLASGLCAVALLFYGFIFYEAGQYLYALLALTTFGVIVPFFYYNVFGKQDRQKKIFMGDTGSLTLGMIVGFLAVLICRMPVSVDNDANPVLVASVPLLIPCFDVIRVFIHRVRAGANPFQPDNNHIHHKLLALGLSQRVAMLTIILTAILFVLCNMFLAKFVDSTLLLLADALLYTLLNVGLSRKIKRKQVETTI